MVFETKVVIENSNISSISFVDSGLRLLKGNIWGAIVIFQML